jgi:hypothetical protein
MEVAKILASYFYVGEGKIKKCVANTSEIEGIDQDTVYSYVIDMIGHTETLPRDIVVSSFNLLPPDQFVKICQLSADYHSLCETPALWLVYLRARPQKDWDVIIKHILGVEYPPRVLKIILQQYMQLYRTSAIDTIFHIIDSYDIDTLYDILTSAGVGEFKEMLKKLIVALGPLPNDDKFVNIVLTQKQEYLCYMSWFGRYLIKRKNKIAINVARFNNYKILLGQFNYNHKKDNKDILFLSIAYYFTNLQEIYDLTHRLQFVAQNRVVLSVINDGYYFMNSTLARDILSRNPTILQQDYIIGNAKEHIKALLRI